MDILKQKFEEKAAPLAQEIKAMLKEHGNMVIDTATIAQIYGGMRDITSMVWEPSLLDAQEGISFRGYSIPQLRDLLPKAEGGQEPLPEGLFWLMLVGEIPTAEEVKWLTAQWTARATVPQHTYDMLNALPLDTHPMTQFSMAILSMQTDSIFADRYAKGMPKAEYWDAYYEDTMNLVARLPIVAAYIYRRVFHNGEHIAADKNLDWAGNFAKMLGVTDNESFTSLMRLYLTIHADHEGGNASAHATHLVGSTLSDPYYSLSGGMNALAGPLHGLANQEVIKWIFEMVEKLGTDTPTDAQLEEYVNNTLKSGKVVPGYGHAVLRKPDPRYTAQQDFAANYIKDDAIVAIVAQIFRVVPPILSSLGKIKNPWPNVDAHSGALLIHYGMKEYSFYTVLFGVSRALGVLASGVWSRYLGFPLERPKSVTTADVKAFIAAKIATPQA
jgi:citrate synthase